MTELKCTIEKGWVILIISKDTEPRGDFLVYNQWISGNDDTKFYHFDTIEEANKYLVENKIKKKFIPNRYGMVDLVDL